MNSHVRVMRDTDDVAVFLDDTVGPAVAHRLGCDGPAATAMLSPAPRAAAHHHHYPHHASYAYGGCGAGGVDVDAALAHYGIHGTGGPAAFYHDAAANLYASPSRDDTAHLGRFPSAGKAAPGLRPLSFAVGGSGVATPGRGAFAGDLTNAFLEASKRGGHAGGLTPTAPGSGGAESGLTPFRKPVGEPRGATLLLAPAKAKEHAATSPLPAARFAEASTAAMTPPSAVPAEAASGANAEALADLQRHCTRLQAMHDFQRERREQAELRCTEFQEKLQEKITEVIGLSSRLDESKRFIRQLKKEVAASKQRVLESANAPYADTSRQVEIKFEKIFKQREEAFAREFRALEDRTLALEDVLADVEAQTQPEADPALRLAAGLDGPADAAGSGEDDATARRLKPFSLGAMLADAYGRVAGLTEELAATRARLREEEARRRAAEDANMAALDGQRLAEEAVKADLDRAAERVATAEAQERRLASTLLVLKKRLSAAELALAKERHALPT